MREIDLGNGKKAIVDDEDYPYLSRFPWCLGTTGHPMRSVREGVQVAMVLFVKPCPKGKRLIFRNNNPLDLRKENIEVSSWATASVHARKTSKPTTSKYKGVSWAARAKKWVAVLTMRNAEGKRVRVLYKYFDDERLAAKAYNEKSRELYGDLAYQNKID